MKLHQFSLLLLLILSSCLSGPDSPTNEEVIQEEIQRLEADPETVGYEYLEPAYTAIGTLYDMSKLWGLQQVTSDETYVPATGAGWDDGMIWAQLQDHSWGRDHVFMLETWNTLLQAQSSILQAQYFIFQAKSSPAIDGLVAESECLKAFFNFHLIDIFGQVPTRNEYDELIVYKRDEATAWAIGQLENNMDKLPSKLKYNDSRALYRMNKWVAKATLAKLYLNKKEFMEESDFFPEDMERVEELCDEIISSNEYKLDADYWNIFSKNNSNNISLFDEIIFATREYNTNVFPTQVLHSAHTGTAWGSFSTLADFYNAFDPDDPRFKGPRIPELQANFGFNAGYQFDEAGDTLRIITGNPLFYTIDINPDGPSSTQGARPIKYQPDLDNGINVSNNLFVILRLGEIYIMKAEAAFRNGDQNLSLQTLNELRQKRGAGILTEINEQTILDEYGFELWWEGQRRTHMIRFGKFNDPLSTRPDGSETFYKLFPIPPIALDLNPLLVQNEGY